MKKVFLLISASLLIPGLLMARKPAGIYHDGWIDFNKNGAMDIYEDPSADIEKRVEDLLSQMNINEKTCQLVTLYGYGRVAKDSLPTPQWKNEIWKDGIANIDEMLNGVGNKSALVEDMLYPFSNHVKALNTIQKWFIEETRLGIPVDFTNEGIHGLNHAKATPLPAPIAIGSTWNKELVYRAGEIVGQEGKALGYTNVYAPILDVARDQRWGRVVETYGEEPYLISRLGINMVKGIQDQGIGSTLKHYAVYSIPKGGRDGSVRTDPHVAPREMHQLYMYPFKEVIRKAHPVGVMASYNDYDGEPIIASHYFMTELLRWEYGFDGYVVSDSGASEFVYSKHKTAPDFKDAIRQELEAGLNVHTNFSQPKNFITNLRQLIDENRISMEVIDERVRQVLRVKFRLGLFDAPFKDEKTADQVVGIDKHMDFVQEMQEQAMVLLKNEGGLLPLNKDGIRKVLVTGPLADESNMMISRYGPNRLETVTVLQGLRDYLSKSSVQVDYAKGCDVVDKNFPESEVLRTPLTREEKDGIEEAVRKAGDADVVICVLGEDDFTTGESRSRSSLDLPGRQEDLLRALEETGKPVVLVLINGQPLTINYAKAYIPSILEAWFPTCIGGKVIAETLFGDHNPSGRLTITFPKTVGQLEYNFPFKPKSQAGQPSSGPNGSGNTRVSGELFEFGFGLSYTTFAYSNLQVSPKVQATKGEYTVKCDVENTGSRAGYEVVQLYVSDKISSVTTYESILRGFEKVYLNPGEKKTVTFTIKPEDLQILDKNMNWTVEPGEFVFMIGKSSKDIQLKDTVRAESL